MLGALGPYSHDTMVGRGPVAKDIYKSAALNLQRANMCMVGMRVTYLQEKNDPLHVTRHGKMHAI